MSQGALLPLRKSTVRSEVSGEERVASHRGYKLFLVVL